LNRPIIQTACDSFGFGCVIPDLCEKRQSRSFRRFFRVAEPPFPTPYPQIAYESLNAVLQRGLEPK
jgi:hypothetical protein